MVAGLGGAYIFGMSLRSMFLIFVLIALLFGAGWTSLHMWNSIGEDASAGGKGMSHVGITALILGGLGTVALGGGLMTLVFFSSRRGYDDAADQKTRPPEDR